MNHTEPLGISYDTLVRFFEATEGNYRNALYILCGTCRHQRENGCGDFLFVPGHDCLPILLPLKDTEIFIGHSIDSSDCAGILNNSAFLSLYHQWIMLHTVSDETCPFHQMLHLLNTKKGKSW